MKPQQDFAAHGSAILGLYPWLQPQAATRHTLSLDLAEEHSEGAGTACLHSGCDQIASCGNQGGAKRRSIIQRAAQKKRPLKPCDGVLGGLARGDW